MALQTTTAEADARLVSKSNDVNVTGFTLVRMWPFIDATAADTLGTTLDAIATYTNPQADGQSYTGTFVNSRVYLDEAASGRGGVQENNERYVNIIQTLIKVTTVDGDSDLTNPLIVPQKDEVLDLQAYEEGNRDTLVLEYRNVNPASRDNCMDKSKVTDAELVAIANALMTDPTDINYLSRDFREETDNTGTFRVVFMISAWTNVNEAGDEPTTWRNDSYGNTDLANSKYGARATHSQSATGVPIGDVQDVIANTAPSDSDHAVTNVSGRDNKDGSGTVARTETRKGLFAEGTGSGVLIDKQPQNGNQPASETWLWSDLKETDADTLASDCDTNAADMNGATYRASATSSWVLRSYRKLLKPGVFNDGDQLFDFIRTTYVPIWTYSVFGTRHDTVTEVIWKYDQVTVYDSSKNASKKNRTVYRTVFSSDSSAITYAELSTPYYDSLEVEKHMGYVEYIGTSASGTGQWAGYKVILA